MDSNLVYKLEDFISLGYQWIEKIEEEYRDNPHNVSAILDHYYRLVGEWESQVKQGLPNISRAARFSAAKSSDPIFQVGKDRSIQNLVKSIRAKIDVLEDYRKELHQSIVSLGPQSRINVGSIDNSTNIIGDQFSIAINELEAEFKQSYEGSDKGELLAMIKELKGKRLEASKVRRILGTLLARGAEIAQIASLVTQILTILPK